MEVTANERFSAQYMTATTLQDQMKAAALRPELIWGMCVAGDRQAATAGAEASQPAYTCATLRWWHRSCVAPDSRRDFMASMCDACFTTADQARTVETACMLKVGLSSSMLSLPSGRTHTTPPPPLSPTLADKTPRAS